MSEKNNNDLFFLTWAHGVNSRHEVISALESNVDCLETDLFYNTELKETYHCHQPDTRGDLNFNDFYDLSSSSKKLIKLDFKNTKAFSKNIMSILKFEDKRLMLNADVVASSFCDSLNVDLSEFLNLSLMKKSHISIGWSVKNNGFSYTWSDVFKMFKVLNSLDIDKSRMVTLAISVQMTRLTSLHKLLWIVSVLSNKMNISLTLWSFRNVHQVNLEDIIEIRKRLKKTQLLIDIPQLKDQMLDLYKQKPNVWQPNIIVNINHENIGFYKSRTSFVINKPQKFNFQISFEALNIYLCFISNKSQSQMNSHLLIKDGISNKIISKISSSDVIKSTKNSFLNPQRSDGYIEIVYHITTTSSNTLDINYVFNYSSNQLGSIKDVEFEPVRSILLDNYENDMKFEMELNVELCLNDSLVVVDLARNDTAFY